MLLATLLAVHLSAAPFAGQGVCNGSDLPARIAAMSPQEGAAALARSDLGSDHGTLACAEALAVEYELRQEWLEKRYFTAARAALAERRGDPVAAVALLEPLVGHQHHTVAIPADFHAFLSRAYQAARRLPEAEGQRRLALAALPTDPPFALTQAEVRDLPAQPLPAALVPIAPPNPEQNLVDLSSIRIEGDIRTYDTLLIFPADEDGEAVRRIERRVDCRTYRGEVLKITRLKADGSVLEDLPVEDSREDYNALLDHRRRMICAADAGNPADAAPIETALRLFRSRGP